MALKRVLFLVFDGFEIIDLSGPMSVFSAANTLANSVADRQRYRLETVSSDGGEVASSSGVSINTRSLSELRFKATDTVLVSGGPGEALRAAIRDGTLLAALQRASSTAERVGSVCSGAHLLGASGLLDGRRCTTHWAACRQLEEHYPGAEVDFNALYVTDGKLWTSAGATTGIDMALSMVEADAGAALMSEVAKWLIVYAKRPGHQSQFSSVLQAQGAAGGRFAPVVDWLAENLDRPIRVSDLAAKASMSERSFYRQFSRSIGTTPSKFVDALRLERAKLLLESGLPVKAVTAKIGFRSEAAFRTAFKGEFGTTPALYAKMFAGVSAVR